MLPFKITAVSREASSPSVTLERGRYRMRAPSARPVTNGSRRGLQVRNTNQSTYIALLLVLLATASITSFGVAYYLFSTRWDTRAFHSINNSSADREIQVVPFDLDSDFDLNHLNLEERYLAYLPHSGFHNQRIAFENALVLSRLLNRTLLVPPVRLGDKPVRYVKFEALRQFLGLSDKRGLRHCPRVPARVPLPPECFDYFDYTHIRWDWLVNLTEMMSQQKLRQRNDLTEEWIRQHLQIPEWDTYTLRDSNPYDYRFLDTVTDVSPMKDKYSNSVYIPTLALSTERLIQIGSLFGSSRLRLKNAANIQLRKEIRRSMAFTNVHLVQAAALIKAALGHIYLGAHVRLGDGHFRANIHANGRLVWWKLVHELLEFNIEETLSLENSIQESTVDAVTLFAPAFSVDRAALRVPYGPHLPLPANPSPTLPCRGKRHTSAHLKKLNVPLFISTDVKDPLTSPSMRRFLKTFPCTFFLSDFGPHTASLERLQNAYDDVMLGNFLLPFLDAMVIGRAWKMVGTDGSTFSTFASDILWRTYHGWEIVQRG